MSIILEQLSTLSDRGLRRLLGARTFLRGLDYEKRKVVNEVKVGNANATGSVKGSDEEPYMVDIGVGSDGITAHCTCPAFSKSGQRCKHIAALLINVRNQARAALPKQAPVPPPTAGPPQPVENKSKKRERRRRNGQPTNPTAPLSPVKTEYNNRGTGISAWLAQESNIRRIELEFRVHVRANALTVTVLDLDSRTALLPSHALTWQALAPTEDRNALRILSRFESGNPRHPAVDIRGEDAADLLNNLKGRRVLLEPALMQLRFADEALRPSFSLETVGEESIVAKVAFERPDVSRKYGFQQGGWFEGAPGWHIDINDGIARPLDYRVSPAALRRLMRAPAIAEPTASLLDLVTNGLPRVALEIGAPLPDLSQVADVVDLTPRFVLRATGTLIECDATLRAIYGDLEVEVRADGMSPPVIVLPPRPHQPRATCVRADIAAQQLAVAQLVDAGLDTNENGDAFLARGQSAVKFWTDGLPALPSDWDYYVPQNLSGAKMRSSGIEMHARVSSGMDWLSLQISYECDGVGVSRAELEACLREGRKYVKLSDNSFAPIEVARIQELVDRELELITAGGNTDRLPLSQAGRVQELLEQADKSVIGASTKGLFNKLSSIDEIKAAKKPRGLKATLRPYQEQGLSWLKFIDEIGSGGVLADDMGLGKTIQTIALLLTVKASQKSLKTLIVAPTSVVTNWVREVEKFAPTLKLALWHGAARKEQKDELNDANIVVTSYALLRRDKELLSGLDLDYLILDEAQHIKNPTSATAQAARSIGARHRLALTGTPIENRLSEIWSIFEFVSPGLLGTLSKFEERYARPIDQGDHKAAARLRSIIHPFILRRTKSEVAKDLPPKIEVDKIVDLTPDQRALYLQVLREVKAQVMGEVERVGVGKSQLHILAGLTRLRQAACDPRLLGTPREFSHDDSGKLAALRELVSEAESGGHKVLVFSQFTSMLKLVADAFHEDKIRFEYLDGATVDRESRIERFQNDPSITVFLISLKAGGSGLNLTAADTVVHFDPWWNPAVEDQASDRAHRIGQNKVVTVYRFVAAGTIEEKILQLKAKKRELVSSVLTEDAGGAKKLTRSDIDELFEDSLI